MACISRSMYHHCTLAPPAHLAYLPRTFRLEIQMAERRWHGLCKLPRPCRNMPRPLFYLAGQAASAGKPAKLAGTEPFWGMRIECATLKIFQIYRYAQ